MKKIHTLLVAMVCMAVVNFANGQATGSTYKTAIGVKFYPGALTIKHFVKPNAALEGLAYFWGDGFRLTGLYEWHGNIKGAEGLKWYVGGGAHADFWDSEYKKEHEDNGGVGAGLDGVIGLDYKFKGAPINISLDYQPSVTFIGDNYSNTNWAGFAIRFAF